MVLASLEVPGAATVEPEDSTVVSLLSALALAQELVEALAIAGSESSEFSPSSPSEDEATPELSDSGVAVLAVST